LKLQLIFLTTLWPFAVSRLKGDSLNDVKIIVEAHLKNIQTYV
jgi:hypothetical protein